MNEDKKRTVKVSQTVWKDLRLLSVEYEMSISKVIEILLVKMKENK